MATRLSALIAEFLAAGMSNEDSIKLARETDALERAEKTKARNKSAELELAKAKQEAEMAQAEKVKLIEIESANEKEKASVDYSGKNMKPRWKKRKHSLSCNVRNKRLK